MGTAPCDGRVILPADLLGTRLDRESVSKGHEVALQVHGRELQSDRLSVLEERVKHIQGSREICNLNVGGDRSPQVLTTEIVGKEAKELRTGIIVNRVVLDLGQN